MKIAVLKEGAAGERRVAATAETVKKFIGLSATVAVESGAGDAASFDDAGYSGAGATVGKRADVLKDADIVLGVQGFAAELVTGAEAGLCIEPENEVELVEAVVRLAGDPALGRRLGAAGRARLAARYDVERLAGEYLELLEGVAR